MRQSILGSVRHGEELIWLLPVTAATLLLFLAGQAAGIRHGISAAAIFGDIGVSVRPTLPLLVCLLMLSLAVRPILLRSREPLQSLTEPLRNRFASPVMGLATLAPVALMPLLFVGFGILKMVMPLYAPFAWDDTFAAADRTLFFGYQPWQLTHAVLGGESSTVAIDALYAFWVPLLAVAGFGFALLAPRYERARFFVSFAAIWVLLGVVGAWATSSAGPCFAARIGASSAADYAPLMERLRLIAGPDLLGISTFRWQNVLWTAHVDRHYAFAMGISAMPSLHNAIAILYALALSRLGRAAGLLGWLYALVIFVGSIHLGWHYAVDGLAATAGVLLIWWGAGRYLDRSGYAAAVARPAADEPPRTAAPALA
jgi:hypothetical protein